MTKIFNVQIKK